MVSILVAIFFKNCSGYCLVSSIFLVEVLGDYSELLLKISQDVYGFENDSCLLSYLYALVLFYCLLIYFF